MRKFSKDYRLQGYSHPDITEEFTEVTGRIARRHRLKYNGKKLRPGPLLNALAVWFLDLDESERAAITKAMVARLEAFMAASENGNDSGRQSEPEVDVEVVPAPAKARAKRKQG